MDMQSWEKEVLRERFQTPHARYLLMQVKGSPLANEARLRASTARRWLCRLYRCSM